MGLRSEVESFGKGAGVVLDYLASSFDRITQHIGYYVSNMVLAGFELFKCPVSLCRAFFNESKLMQIAEEERVVLGRNYRREKRTNSELFCSESFPDMDDARLKK